MNKLFRKLTFRTIKSNLKQFASVILIVFLGVMLLSGFIANSYSFKKNISNYFDETNLAKTWLYVSGVTDDDRKFFESENIEYDERLYLEVSTSISGKPATNSAKIYVGKGKISTPYIESGIIGCLIDKNVMKNHGIKPTFDSINFSVPNEMFGEIDLSFSISGSMCLDECADTYSSWPVFIEEELFLNKLNSKLSEIQTELNIPANEQKKLTEVPYNQILLKTDDEATISKIKNYYAAGENEEDTSKLLYVFDGDSVESVVLLNSEISQSRKMIYVFPIIFLVVSILVILTTIDQLVLQERQKIGTLKSIGISDRKILRHYSLYGGVLCFVGALFGLVLGVVIIPRIMFIKYDLVYSIPSDFVRFRVPFLWVLLVLILVVAMGYFVSLLSCHKILHKKPIECLRYDLKVDSKTLTKNKGKFKKLPLPIKMASRNIRIKPMRTLMATIGIAGCVALLLCGFGIGDTLKHSIKNDLGKVFKYDVTTTYVSSDFEENLKKTNGLKNYELYDQYYGSAVFGSKTKNTNVFKIPENSAFTTIKLKGNEVFISKSVADDLGVKVGDEVVATIGGITEKFKVTSIGKTCVVNGIFTAKNLAYEESYATKHAWISCTNAKLVAEQVNKINGTNSALSMEEFKDGAENKISAIDLMTNTLKFFAIMLAIIVLLNLIFLILKERVKELATLKVLGQDMFHITLSIYFEILFMSLIGLVFGMCLGYPLMVLVLKVNRVQVFNFLYYISPLSFVWTTLIVLATQVVITALCFVKVKKVNMIESLKSVE